MIRDAIEQFAEQFSYEPVVLNGENLQKKKRFLLCGMGGSHLQGGIVRMLRPSLDLMIHRDYGLPECVSQDRLVIVSSYSGNTEETLSAFKEALKKGFPLAASSTGGKLIELAKRHGVPHVQLPQKGIQPRSALGYATNALLKLLGEEELLSSMKEFSERLSPGALEKEGEELARQLSGKVPVIYSSTKNQPVAYNWKIKFNESAKIPAFCSAIPELNHNEMTGFDVVDSTKELSRNMAVVLLSDAQDHPGIRKRMEAVKELYGARGIQVVEQEFRGETLPERIFSSLMLADWTAWHAAQFYGTEPEQVPMIEEFKKRIAG